MLDIKFVRQNPKTIEKELSKRGIKADIVRFLSLDKERRELIAKIEKLREKQNKSSKKIIKPDEKMIKEMKKIKEEINKLNLLLTEKENRFQELMLKLPNISHPSVPTGPDESGNTVNHKWGEKPEFKFKPKDHLEIGERLDLIDVKRAAKISGARFVLLKNEAVLLEFALIRFVMDLLTQKGFSLVVSPVLVKKEAMYGTGFFPAEANEYYKIEGEDLYLAGTAEVPLASMHMNEIFKKEDLPLKYAGFSSCFRKEAGSYGKDTRGMFRVHQFDKIEMFIFSLPEKSWDEYEQLSKIAEEIFQKLAIHYQVVNICTGDLGVPNAKKLDIEAWFPGQNRYREVVSCSHDTDFQARRLGIKYNNEKGQKEYIHTLNSTACAIGRTIIAILENYQQEDGRVIVPKVLQSYLGKKKI